MYLEDNKDNTDKQDDVDLKHSKRRSEADKQYWWQLGMKVFAESTGWIAGPVLVALLAGNFLDDRFDSEPLFSIGLTIVAFVISSVGVAITGVKYIKLIDSHEDRQSKKTQLDIKDKGKH